MAIQGHIFVQVGDKTALLSDGNPAYHNPNIPPGTDAVQSWGPIGRQMDRPVTEIHEYETCYRDGAIAVFGPYHDETRQPPSDRTVTVLP